MIPILHDVVRWLYFILFGLLLVRAFLSWMPMVRSGGLVDFVFAVTEPFLAPIRRLIARSPLGGPGMMLDFSPLIAFVLLGFMRTFLTSLLNFAAGMIG